MLWLEDQLVIRVVLHVHPLELRPTWGFRSQLWSPENYHIPTCPCWAAHTTNRSTLEHAICNRILQTGQNSKNILEIFDLNNYGVWVYKIEVLDENQNFCRNRNFCLESKFWSKTKFWPKIDILVGNRNFGWKSNFWSKSKFWSKIEFLVEIDIWSKSKFWSKIDNAQLHNFLKYFKNPSLCQKLTLLKIARSVYKMTIFNFKLLQHIKYTFRHIG